MPTTASLLLQGVDGPEYAAHIGQLTIVVYSYILIMNLLKIQIRIFIWWKDVDIA